MQKVKSYKCPGCGMKYKSLTTWGNHVSVHHPEYIPQGWSYARYYYYILTGKKNGSCIVCNKKLIGMKQLRNMKDSVRILNVNLNIEKCLKETRI